jgi:hypothetical protein
LFPPEGNIKNLGAYSLCLQTVLNESGASSFAGRELPEHIITFTVVGKVSGFHPKLCHYNLSMVLFLQRGQLKSSQWGIVTVLSALLLRSEFHLSFMMAVVILLYHLPGSNQLLKLRE